MGYMRHHAIVVSSWDEKQLNIAHECAKRFFGHTVSNIVTGFSNFESSFFIGPDGSKEGWDESDEGDIRRASYTDYLRSFEYEDNSTPVKWVEVQYGDDNYETKIIHDSDDSMRDQRQ